MSICVPMHAAGVYTGTGLKLKVYFLPSTVHKHTGKFVKHWPENTVSPSKWILSEK